MVGPKKCTNSVSKGRVSTCSKIESGNNHQKWNKPAAAVNVSNSHCGAGSAKNSTTTTVVQRQKSSFSKSHFSLTFI